jgi:ComF family protein
LIDIRSKIKQLLLPSSCVLCGAQAGASLLCPNCEADLPWHSISHCPVCALPTARGDICGHCLKHPPAFDATHAAFQYRFPVDAVLQRYKYSGMLAVAQLMGDMLARTLRDASLPDLLLPMPLHPARLQERGFNQAVEIGRVLSARLGIPMASRLGMRTRLTPPQAGLDWKARRRNVRGVFTCSERLDGKRIALLDDVMTTGASLDALAQAVKNAGAAHIECWVVARTLPR